MTDSEFEQQARQLRQKAVDASRSYGAGHAEAEDIAQDVMLHLWQLRRELDRYRSLEAVAVQAARRLTYNLHRRQPLLPLTGQEQCDKVGADPSQQLVEREDDEWLQLRLSQLPSTQHAVLYMRQVEHRSSDESSRLLGISEASVRTLLSRARRKLLEEIKKRNQSPL
jgi:RNA polymerase sigma-70 factor (ECF subfamily)